MLLATTQVEELNPLPRDLLDEGRRQAPPARSKGAMVFRDPSEEDRVWVLFDWDEEGWASFVSDPDVPPIMKEAGHKGKPQVGEFAGRYDA
jgi:hypothetical protein